MPKGKSKTKQHSENYQPKAAIEARLAVVTAENSALRGELAAHGAFTEHILTTVAPLTPSAVCIDHETIGVLVPEDGALKSFIKLSRTAAEYLRNQLNISLTLQGHALTKWNELMEEARQARENSNIAAIFAVPKAGSSRIVDRAAERS